MNAAAAAPSSFVPSRYQAALFDWIDRQVALCCEGKRTREEAGEPICAVVEAVAGSGKTTTLRQALLRIPPRASCLFLAFNVSIKDELSAKLKEAGIKHCRAMTMNGLGSMAWGRAMGSRAEVDRDKTQRILSWLCDPARDIPPGWGPRLKEIAQKDRPLGMPLGTIGKLVALMKHYVVVPALLAGKSLGGMGTPRGLRGDSDDDLRELADRYDLALQSDDPACEIAEEEILDLARDALVLSIVKGQKLIDLDDQIYLPVIFKVRCRTYDWLFVDEAQDVSHCNRQLLHMVRGQAGRLVAVGDSGQAIYGFRGAASDSMELIRREFDAVLLPLSMTYRCSQAVVREAKRLVPSIEAVPGAPEGEVATVATYSPERFVPGQSLVMCRNLAPLVGFAYRLLLAKVPVRVLGRDIGKGLIAFIWSLHPTSLGDLVGKAREWAEQQQEILLRGARRRGGARNDAALQAIQDRLDTIMILCTESGARDVRGVEDQITGLFGDEDGSKVLLSSIHKAKGLEAEDAYLLEPDLLPSPYARKPWQLQQEMNLIYVATTRGKLRYYRITRSGLRLPQRAAA